VALNCAANGRIFEETPFRDIYIQPAANDAGTSLGAALYVQHQILHQPRSFVMRHAYYGPEWSDTGLRDELAISGVTYGQFDDDMLVNETARALASGKIVGWFQGRMEFGPRALGNRSILADPRHAGMKDVLNRRIKHREAFRPFCPSVLAEAAGEYFDNSCASPFMTQAYRVKQDQRNRIPGVVHADGTARLQTVERESNPRFWKLLKAFGEITGVPLLINTSFNDNEPIVAAPREAIDCFIRTDMDLLVMGPFIAAKRHFLPLRIPHASAAGICR
jgi:carbamoyltransferase